MKLTLEELGKGLNGCVEVEIDYDVTPGEAQTWDYPGSPATVELTDVHVTEYTSDTHEVKREDRPDWFAWLDRVVGDILEAEWDEHEERILEDAADREDAAREDYYDSLREMRRCER
jgi:hypothetical protein